MRNYRDLDRTQRYAPFLEYISAAQRMEFDLAFRRVEARRLLAERDLRKSLGQYLSGQLGESVGSLRPIDLLVPFRAYAERVFEAAGAECVELFYDAESYQSFLYRAQKWIMDNMLPMVRESSVENRPQEQIIDLRESLEAFAARTGVRYNPGSSIWFGPSGRVLSRLRSAMSFEPRATALTDNHSWNWLTR